ncbi:MAG: hypothetical protein OXI87_03350 [Albidovulum sp.]|nr:hypothetical protein [Albidovulum sp.]
MCRANHASDRKELAGIEKKTRAMTAVVEDGECVLGMLNRAREVESRLE